VNLFGSLKVNTNANFVGCCTGKSTDLAPFKILSTAIEINVLNPVGHETALIDKALFCVNSRQSVFCGKLDDPLSLSLVVVTSTHPPASAIFVGSSLESPRKYTTNNCATSFMGAFI